MYLSKFQRVNGIFDFTFKIHVQKYVKKILDIQVYEQIQCTKHFA